MTSALQGVGDATSRPEAVPAPEVATARAVQQRERRPGYKSALLVLLAVSLVLCVVTMMSAAIPANRAASIQPADALRID